MGKQWAAQWKVNSFKTDKIYTVSVAKTGRWACDCPAHKFSRAPKSPCKHILKCMSEQEVPVITGVSTQALFESKVARDLNRMTTAVQPIVVVETPTMLVIQTRREICLEED
jgi:hypothetical protein